MFFKVVELQWKGEQRRGGEVRGDPFYSAASASTSTPCISPWWDGSGWGGKEKGVSWDGNGNFGKPKLNYGSTSISPRWDGSGWGGEKGSENKFLKIGEGCEEKKWKSMVFYHLPLGSPRMAKDHTLHFFPHPSLTYSTVGIKWNIWWLYGCLVCCHKWHTCGWYRLAGQTYWREIWADCSQWDLVGPSGILELGQFSIHMWSTSVNL